MLLLTKLLTTFDQNIISNLDCQTLNPTKSTMRLNSSQIIAKRSPTKGGWKMGKAKSLLENIQLRDYGQRSAKSEFVESQNWIFEKSQDIGGIQNFVEEVSSDPNYKQLIKNLEQENNSLKENIKTMKSQIQNMHSMNQSFKSVEQDSPINLIRSQQNSIQLEINKYMELIAVEKSNFMARKQQRKQEAKKLNHMLFQSEKNAKRKREQLNGLITREMENKNMINRKCKQIEKNVQILKSKFSLLGLDEKKNELIREKVEQLRKKVLNLKNKQIQEISNYKNLISNTKKNQSQFKKNTEKKISKFINQLTKILESSDNEALQNLVQKNSSNKDEIRNKNSSSDTKPDENEEDEFKNEKYETLQSLKQRIPYLSVYDNLVIKGLDVQNLSKPKKNMEKDQQKMLEYQRDINSAQEKIKNLSQEEIDVNNFVQALQQKIMKINSQINGNDKDIHIYTNK